MKKLIHLLRMRYDEEYRKAYLKHVKFARIMAVNKSIIEG